MIGKMYEARKNTHGGDRRSSAQNGPLNGERKRISEQIGEEIGVGKNTVKRAEKFAKGIDALRNVAPEVKEQLRQGIMMAPSHAVCGGAGKEDHHERRR